MGGMIAQQFALRHPQRLASLNLLATSSGRIGLPLPRLAVLRLMHTRPTGSDEAAAVDYIDRLFSVLAGPGWPSSPEARRLRALEGFRRAPTGRSSERQLAAILADRRSHRLNQIRAPTLVLHGDADPMLPPAHGRDLAKRINGARYLEIPGWGHDLPDGLMPEMAAHLAENVRNTRPGAV